MKACNVPDVSEKLASEVANIIAQVTRVLRLVVFPFIVVSKKNPKIHKQENRQVFSYDHGGAL